MRTFFHAVTIILFTSCLAENDWALPKYGVLKLTSPDREYALELSDTSEPYTYELKLLRQRVEFAHYSFNGELASAYWSPSRRFVAINNHYGHAGISVWILSLANGAVITSHGSVRDSSYDRYFDEDYFAYLPQVASPELKKLYPGVDDDQLREGYTSVAYGWEGENLLIFHELPYDNFYANQKLEIQAFTTWKVTDHGIAFESVRLRKARDDQYTPMPEAVKKTLNFIP